MSGAIDPAVGLWAFMLQRYLLQPSLGLRRPLGVPRRLSGLRHVRVASLVPVTLPDRTRIAARFGVGVAEVSRRLGKGGGSVIGGRAILALDPNALAHLSAGRKVALVSGTNGKTTTTSLLATALSAGGRVLTNLQGANLPMGLVSALADGPSGAPAVLEVDEAWLPKVVAATRPAAVGLLNLTRDQLDRNNEVRTLASSWRSALAGPAAGTVVANADDPLVAWGAGRATNVVWVGVGQPWTEDSGGCPNCGDRIEFTPSGWSCGACDFARPRTNVELEGDRLRWQDDTTLRLDLALPGRANRANAAVALCVAKVLGADPAAAAGSISSLGQVGGRYAKIVVGGRKARLLLAKNPAGWMETFEVLASPPGPVVVAVNARLADGRDPSWLWDVPFERLRGHFVTVTGERAWDLAVRFRYAEVDHTVIFDPLDAIRHAARGGDLDVVANYTAFQEIRSKVSPVGISTL